MLLLFPASQTSATHSEAKEEQGFGLVDQTSEVRGFTSKESKREQNKREQKMSNFQHSQSGISHRTTTILTAFQTTTPTNGDHDKDDINHSASSDVMLFQHNKQGTFFNATKKQHRD